MIRSAAAIVVAALVGTGLVRCGDDLPEVGDALVVFEIEGGIAGLADRVVIQRDGTVLRSDLDDDQARRAGRLPSRGLTRLRMALEGTPFDSLQDRYHSDDVIDEVRYRIAFDDYRIEVDASAAPRELAPLLSKLSAIEARYSEGCSRTAGR